MFNIQNRRSTLRYNLSMSRQNRALSNAVERAFDILELIGRSEDGLTNAELSKQLKIPKSSASYILRTLEPRGYLRRDAATGKYRLGFRFLVLSRGAMAGLDLKETALPVLRELSERTSLTSNLAILDRFEVVYVEKADAPGFIKMDTWIGRRLPAHATSVGKAILAFLPHSDLEALLNSYALRRVTPKTISSHSKLLKELERVRRQGYSVDDEESSPEVRCIGAPVFGTSGRVEGAISISGTIGQIEGSTLHRFAEHVRDAARKISKQMGYLPTKY